MNVFIALGFELPAMIPEALKRLKINGERKGMDIHWGSVENFHITLHFLGVLPEEERPLVMDKMTLVANRHAPFRLTFKGVGAFPEVKCARALWFGVKNKRAMRSLVEDLGDELTKEGVVVGDQEFVPHLTFGRLRKTRQVKELFSPFLRKNLGLTIATEIRLYESHLGGPYPRYELLFSCPLEVEQQSI